MDGNRESLGQRLREFMEIHNHALAQDGAFYEALGRAVGAWSQVEGALYGLFLTVLKLPHDEPAAAAFHAIVSFQGRLRMVDAAVQFAFAESPHLPKWNTLRERIQRNELRRNSVVHFMPQRTYDEGGLPRLHLAPHPYDANRLHKDPPPIGTVGLLEVAQAVRALARDMMILSLAMSAMDPANAEHMIS